MREIKFRAWDKQERKMVYGVEGAYDGATGGEKTPDVRYADCFSVYLGQKAPHNREPDAYMNWGEDNQELRYEVMQYIGLKDKNGKEIYEGDILGDVWGDACIRWCDKCKCFQLFFLGIDCAACMGDVHWYELVEDDGKLVIVGNVHENPELLEK